MFDFFSGLFAMTQTFEAHGKKWIQLDTIRFIDEPPGVYVLAIENEAPLPAPVQIVFRAKQPEEGNKSDG